MDSEIIVKLTELCISIIALLVSIYLIPFIEAKVGSEKMSLVKKWIDTFVNAAEQIIVGQGKGEEKLNMVTALIKDKLNELNIKLSEEQIRMLIEHAVMEMNRTKER